MATAVLLSAAILGTVSGNSLDLTWEDCGGGATPIKTLDLQPRSFVLGETVKLSSTGISKVPITGGRFELEIRAAWFLRKVFVGDLCAPSLFSFPWDLGFIGWNGLSCPIAAGNLSVSNDMRVSWALPSFLARCTVTTTATAENGDLIFCLRTKTFPGYSGYSDAELYE